MQENKNPWQGDKSKQEGMNAPGKHSNDQQSQQGRQAGTQQHDTKKSDKQDERRPMSGRNPDDDR